MMKYIRQMRVKHYIKNLLIALPFFFRGNYEKQNFTILFWGILSFCFLSSAIYVFNDIRDAGLDKTHAKKKKRPVASGEISIRQAVVLLVFCLVAAFGIALVAQVGGYGFLILYLLLNIAYSMGLKKYPIIDVVILASGFIIRIYYGGYITNTKVSHWLFLVVASASLYLGLGKRRNALYLTDGNPQKHSYPVPFLNQFMQACMTLVVVFYSLWAHEYSNEYMMWTIPLVFIILMKYSLNIESNSDGDPVDVLLHDWILILLCVAYVIVTAVFIHI